MAKKQDIVGQIKGYLTVEKLKPWAIPQVAFYITLYYVQYLLEVRANLWLSSLILLVLINVAVMTCPMVKKCWE